MKKKLVFLRISLFLILICVGSNALANNFECYQSDDGRGVYGYLYRIISYNNSNGGRQWVLLKIKAEVNPDDFGPGLKTSKDVFCKWRKYSTKNNLFPYYPEDEIIEVGNEGIKKKRELHEPWLNDLANKKFRTEEIIIRFKYRITNKKNYVIYGYVLWQNEVQSFWNYVLYKEYNYSNFNKYFSDIKKMLKGKIETKLEKEGVDTNYKGLINF